MTTTNETWAILPFVDCVAMTQQAVQDVLDQTAPTRVLLIDQGSTLESWMQINTWRMNEPQRSRVVAWRFDPALSLAAAWNAGLRYVEAAGGTQAWVLNNDVRLHPEMLACLQEGLGRRTAGFVTGIGVTPDETFRGLDVQHGPADQIVPAPAPNYDRDFGGPDFSCFLITVAFWEQFHFDERFDPAYCEDVDLHRRVMLAGEGQRIFGLNVPFVHFASGTLNSRSPEQQERFHQQYTRVLEIYKEKWGGGPNRETETVPLQLGPTDQDLAAIAKQQATCERITTPELFAWEQHVHADTVARAAGAQVVEERQELLKKLAQSEE